MAKYKGTAVQSQKQEFTQNIEIDTIEGDLTVTGNVVSSTSPTANTHLTNKGYVDTQVSNLVDSAPDLLNTLNEISAAIGDDATFALSTQNQLDLKAPLANPTFTGTVTVPTPSGNTDAVTKGYADTALALKAPLASPTFTGVVTVPTPSNNTDATTKNYVDSALSVKSPLASPTFTGTVTVPTPSNDTDAATKNYVDVTSTAKAAALSIALG
jgi:hypothetical protein